MHKLVVLGRRPPAGANVYQAHAERCGAPALRPDRALSLTAKIHDDGDSKFSELFKTFCVWLGAAVEKIIHFADAGQTGEFCFFRERRRFRRSRREHRGRGRLREG